MTRGGAWRCSRLALGVILLAGFATEPGGRAKGEAIAVRHAEGSLHGFLELRDANGALLAPGELVQQTTGGLLESRMTFHFADSSFFEEKVAFAQRGVFTMVTYHLVQRGPAFAQDIDALLERGARTWRVTTRSRDGKEERREGSMDLPADTYNGMVIVVARNLARGDTQTVHVVAFTPSPRVVDLELAPEGREGVRMGQHEASTVRYVFKPRLHGLVGLVAGIAGKIPPDSHMWVAGDTVPAFVRFQGPLYSGPVWRIDLVGPRWER